MKQNNHQNDFFAIKKIGEEKNKNVNDSLANIYRDKNGRIPDITKLDIKRKSGLIRFLKGLLFLLIFTGGLLYFIYYIFEGSLFKDSGQVALAIEAPKSVMSGEEIIYKITIDNSKKAGARDLLLELTYPEKFIFKKMAPEISEARPEELNFAYLEPRSRKEIEITGVLFGAKNDSHVLSAKLTYRPGNFNSYFKVNNFANTTIETTPLEVKIEGPAGPILNETAEYEIKYKNISGRELNNLYLVLNLPEQFAVESIEPSLNNDNKIEFDLLKINESDSIKIKGKFLEEAEGAIVVEAFGESAEQKSYTLAKASKNISVLKNELSLTLLINGSAGDQAINFSDALNITLAYQNNGAVDMEGIIIKVRIPSSLVDWQTLQDQNGGQRVAEEISWTSQEIAGLALLEPAEEGAVDFKINLKDANALAKSELKEKTIEIDSSASIARLGENTDKINVAGSKIVLNLNSDVKLRAGLRYFNDDNIAVGQGPLPPKVGQETTYRLYWTLTNDLHELEEIKISAVLPQAVRWLNQYDLGAGTLTYNDQSREITWSINWLPSDINMLQANMAIAITPTSEDLNKLLILTGEHKLSAVDKETQGTIQLKLSPLTSDLIDDPVMQGRGLVSE